MQLVNSYVKIMPQDNTLLGAYKQIELAGRTSYKSEDRITDNSAKDFVEMLISRGHTSPLEQGTIYLWFKLGSPTLDENYLYLSEVKRRYENNKYSKVVERKLSSGLTWIYITTNLRVIFENNWEGDLDLICEPGNFHKKRITARFFCSRAIANELVRHRTFSFVQESTRYCNYSKDKFNNELTYIIPTWLNLDAGTYIQANIADFKNSDTGTVYTTLPEISFLGALKTVENEYFELLKSGCKPQEARDVLPLALKTEIVMTGYEDDWNHFFSLRCDSAAHPDMRKLANDLKQQMTCQ